MTTDSNLDGWESRLLVFDRSGSGLVHSFVLDQSCASFKDNSAITESWVQTKSFVDFAVVSHENKLYITGGYNTDVRRHTKRVLRYDPVLDEWSENFPPMLKSRCMHQALVFDDRIHVIGGREKTDGRTTSCCDVYQPGAETWEKGSGLIGPRANHACATMGQEMYCSGGWNNDVPHENMWVYERDKWRQMDHDCPPKLTQNLERHCMVGVDGILYFIGGITYSRGQDDKLSKKTLSAVEAFKFRLPYSELSAVDMITPWVRNLPPMTYPRHSAASLVLGKKIFMIGGSDTDTNEEVKTVEAFDLENNTWEQVFTLKPDGFSNVTCAILKFPPEPEPPDPYADVKKLTERWVLW
ncbi:kelch-like protein 9 [Lingula anatina]|uniref:Kelch-like protein 9 n=1 Tax=Lingula anatina TaxID=7574 RepID=A0A1S3JV65_LINAN|nr:kelch-like protein 9 [Lingula anatina]|eukprot:XP_013414187.1 kelch-like protein 9 [Lingula anatina]